MGFAELFQTGGMTLVIGLVITFSVLTLLILCIRIMSRLNRGGTTDAARPRAADHPRPVQDALPAEDEDEVVAAIMAVLAALSQQGAGRFRLKAFRQVRGDGAWRQAARQDIMDARY